jgi:hypothetical protein
MVITAEHYSPIYEPLLENVQQRMGYSYNDLLKVGQIKDAYDTMNWIKCSILPEQNQYTPLRYHDPTNSLESAALTMVTPYNIQWQQQPNNSDGINGQLGASDMFLATFDDSPWCVIVIYNPNPNYARWVYKWTWNGTTRIYFNGEGKIRANKAQHDSSDPTNWDPHGTYLYCQADADDNRYFWIDCKPGVVDGADSTYNSTLTVLVPGVTVSGGTSFYFNIGLYRYFNGVPQLCQQATVASNMTVVGGVGVITFTLNTNDIDPATNTFPTYSDYYTLRVANLTTVAADRAAAQTVLATGFEVTQQGKMSVLEHHAVEEAESLSVTWSKKGRIVAQGVRVAQDGMLQYVNGKITGLTAWDGDSWYQLFQYGLMLGDRCFQKCWKEPGAITGELDEGGYMYHKPTEITDFCWTEWAVIDEVRE